MTVLDRVVNAPRDRYDVKVDAHARMWINGLCASPIEASLTAAVYRMMDEVRFGTHFKLWESEPRTFPGHFTSRSRTTLAFLQQPIGPYRVDLAIGIYDLNIMPGDDPGAPDVYTIHKLPLIVIESDGHDFHERTKEQAAHDKRRDRYLVGLGYRVLRFTGSEIHRDADGCAEQVSNLVETLSDEAIPF